VAGFAAAVIAVNGAILALALALTDGWLWTFLVTMPNRHRSSVSLGGSIGDLFRSVGPALIVLGIMAGGLALGRRRSGRPLRRWPTSRERQLVALLLVFIAIDLIPAIEFRRAEGAVHNQYLGIAWALALLVALCWARARRRGAAAMALATGAVALAFAASVSSGIQRRAAYHFAVVLPSVGAHATVTEVPPPLLEYARHHRVYHPALSWVSALSEPRVYPNHENIQQLLAAGYQPRYLSNALLGRHFDAVYLFQDNWLRAVGSGTGTWEDNYIWKLNEVVRAKYLPAYRVKILGLQTANVVPAFFGYTGGGLFLRRPGADPAPWMRDCFGPFAIAGQRWAIRRGGGFWCRPGGQGTVVQLVRTPAVESELRSESTGHVLTGPISVALPRQLGSFSVGLGDWRVEGQRVGDAIHLRMIGHDRVYASDRVQGSRVQLRLRGRLVATGTVSADPGLPSALVTFPLAGAQAASLRASAESRASFDLGRVSLARLVP
jgi:hypothetical protein